MGAINNSNLLCRTKTNDGNPHSERVFRFIENYGDEQGTMKYINYKPAQLRMYEGKKWFVEYYYRIPKEFQDKYPGQKWKRFKVYEDINVFKSEEYAQILFTAVKRALAKGYNPFKKKQLKLHELEYDVELSKDWTISAALEHFLQVWEGRGLEPQSYNKYERAIRFFIEWLDDHKMKFDNVTKIRNKHVELYLEETKKLKKWSNRTYNNNKTFLNTAFKFLKKKEIITSNPCEDVDRLRTHSKKHKYYPPKILDKVVAAMKEHDPYLYFACQVVYYLCVRSEKELRKLKVKGIMPERKQVFIPAEDTKTDIDRYIPLGDDMLKIFQERKILEYDPQYYVFSVPHKNKFVPDGHPGPEPFSPGFFSKRFAKIRDIVCISNDYTIFSFRHTRAVHLKLDGARDEQIMSLMGHTDFATTAKYLRDLGLTVDPEGINAKTRKF